MRTFPFLMPFFAASLLFNSGISTAQEPEKPDEEKGKKEEDGLVARGDQFYKIYTADDPISWEDARKACEERGGHLATGETAEELEFLLNHFRENGPEEQNLWLGAVRHSRQNQKESSNSEPWVWLSGSTTDSSEIKSSYFNYRSSNAGLINPRGMLYVADNRILKNGEPPRFISATIDDATKATCYICEWEPDDKTFADFETAKFKGTLTASTTTNDNPDDPTSRVMVPGSVIGENAAGGNVIIPAATGAPEIPLKLKIAQVTGLLISQLTESRNAGSSSRISVTALPVDNSEVALMSFNQPVGEMMTRSLGEVSKFIVLEYDGWPRGRKIEFAFEEKYIPKDGPSASVACALLLDSLVTGDKIHEDFAVTGDMNADGSIQPIGGCAAKLRGATKGGAKVVMFPKANEEQLRDLILTEGLAPFVKIQVLTGEHFKEAREAAVIRSEKTQASLDAFAQIQQLYERNPSQLNSYLKNPQFIAKLKTVLDGMPNHLSARYLALASSGRLPKHLSMMGSMMLIQDSSSQLISAIRAGESTSDLDPNYLADAVGKLSRARTKLDPRTRRYSDAIVDLGKLIRSQKENPPKAYKTQRAAYEKIKAAIAKIIKEEEEIQINEEAMEELR